MEVQRNTRIFSGRGSDVLTIDDSIFHGAAQLSTGPGADTVQIEAHGDPLGLPTLFDGRVSILLSAGGDTLQVGVAGQTGNRAVFADRVQFNGGGGHDTLINSDGNSYASNSRLWIVGFESNTTAPQGIASSSAALSVPLFKQSDSRWSADPMTDENGVNQGTVGQYGCAVTSAAMVAAYYGVNTDPGQLDIWLSNNRGFQSGGYIYWQKVADYSADKLTYQSSLDWTGSYGSGAGPAQWAELQSQLSQGHPVIVKEYLSPTSTHWVVVTGFAGGSVTDPAQYTINDPWPWSTTRTSLADYGTFYAVRVYTGQGGIV